MKLLAPPEVCSPVVVAGREVHLEVDGSLDVDEREAAALAAHGFAPFAASVRAKPRRNKDVVRLESMNSFELINFLRKHRAPQPHPRSRKALLELALSLVPSGDSP